MKMCRYIIFNFLLIDGAIQAIEISESRYIAPYFSKEEGFPICLLSVLKILSNFRANAEYAT